MGRIGVTLSGIERSLLNRLAEANAAATLSSLRIATGSKINHPSDDPSAFLALSKLQAQLGLVTATMSNVTAADSMVSQAQSTADQIRTQLNTIRSELVKDENHTLTSTQRAESQAKIDTAIQQINTLAGTNIEGRRLLDGSADFIYSGRNTSQVSDIAVYASGGAERTISGNVTTTATRAQLTYTGAGGQTTAAATFTLSGDRGSAVLSVANAEALNSVATKINDASHKTGVTASVVGDTLTFSSVDYGASATIAVSVSSGIFAVTGGNGDGTANGTNAAAVINGHSVSATSSSVSGNRFTLSDNGFRYQIEFAAGFTGSFDTVTVSGDALRFALSTELARPSTLAISGLQAVRLGGISGRLDQLSSGGSLAGLGTNTSQAIRVVDEALGDLTRVEGNIDGFHDAAIGSASNLLADLQENLNDGIDGIDLVDDYEETALLARYQALAANSIAGLEILRQQRASVVVLIQRIAGLL